MQHKYNRGYTLKRFWFYAVFSLYVNVISLTCLHAGNIPGEYPTRIYPTSWIGSIPAISTSAPDQSTFEFQSFLRQQTGIFRNIYQAYYKANYSLKSATTSLYGNIEREGDFISRNRMYGNYTIYIPLSKKLKFGAGISGGLINFSMNTESQSINVNKTAIDANCGVSITSDKWFVQASIDQIPQRNIKSISSTFTYKTYYQALSRFNIVSNNRFELKGISHLLLYTDQKSEFLVGIYAAYKKTLWFGTGYNTNNRYLFMINYQWRYEQKHEINMMVGLESGSFHGIYRSSVLQAGVTYHFNNK